MLCLKYLRKRSPFMKIISPPMLKTCSHNLKLNCMENQTVFSENTLFRRRTARGKISGGFSEGQQLQLTQTHTGNLFIFYFDFILIMI